MIVIKLLNRREMICAHIMNDLMAKINVTENIRSQKFRTRKYKFQTKGRIEYSRTNSGKQTVILMSA